MLSLRRTYWDIVHGTSDTVLMFEGNLL
jgi:hypothetical protein